MRKLMAALAIACTAAFSINAQAADKIRVGYWTSGVSLGYGAVLEAKEFLSKRGVEVQFIHFPDVNAPLRALAAGSIDLAFGAPLAGVYSAAAEGVPVKIFVATQPADVQFVVLADSPITSMAELKGKKIGMSPAGSSVAVIAGSVLAGNYGIKASDFSLVGGNESRLAQFLSAKQVDAAALRSVTIEQLSDEVKLRTIGRFSDEWKKLTKSDAAPFNGVGAVSTKLVEEHPELIAKVIAGLRDALVWGGAHKDEVAAILTQKANLPANDAKSYAGLWNSMYRVGFESADIETLKRQHQVFLDSGQIKGALKEDIFATKPYQQSKALK